MIKPSNRKKRNTYDMSKRNEKRKKELKRERWNMTTDLLSRIFDVWSGNFKVWVVALFPFLELICGDVQEVLEGWKGDGLAWIVRDYSESHDRSG